MVDEAQDTNYIQYCIVKMIGKQHKNILMVGDFNQSIFAFRGAHPENIKLFSQEFNPKIIRLKNNYRSTQSILNVAKTVIQKNAGNDKIELQSSSGSGEGVNIHVAQDPASEAKYVVNEIMQNAEFYNREWNDFVIIYRANSLSKEFETQLRMNHVPYRVYGGRSFFDRREIKDFMGYLNFINNPSDFGSFYRIANVPKRGLGPKALEKIVKFAKSNSLNVHEAVREIQSANMGKAITEGCSSLSKVLDVVDNEKDIRQMVRAVFDMTTRKQLQIEDKNDGTEREKNVKGLIQELDSYIGSKQKGTLGGFLHSITLSSDDEKESENANHVSLMTIHASKGLEFPVVFGVAIEKDILPHKMSYGEVDGIAEERRLFYVLLTRAEKDLYLTLSRQRKFKETVASTFLLEAGLDKELSFAWNKTSYNDPYAHDYGDYYEY